MKPSNPAGNYADVNGLKMYYELHGSSGQPLVLIHGGGSTLMTTFGTILPALAKTHRVIAVEMQAHGHTGDRDAFQTFEQDAKDIVELLNQLHIDKANIFGFSNGGQTCIELGIKHPQKINKLVIASAFYKWAGVPDWFSPGFGNPDFNHMPQVYKDEFAKINTDPEALMNMFNKDVQRMLTFKDWSDDAIRSIKAPAFIVQGDQDLSFAEHAVEMSRIIPNSRLCILPGNHGSYMGEAMSWGTESKVPELFVAMVDEFLTGE